MVPISLALWLQTDQVQTLMGEVFEKPLLDHLNGELCPLPSSLYGPSGPFHPHASSRLYLGPFLHPRLRG